MVWGRTVREIGRNASDVCREYWRPAWCGLTRTLCVGGERPGAIISCRAGREKLEGPVQQGENRQKKPVNVACSWTWQLGPAGQNAHKILNRVNYGNTFAKWGKTDESSLNGVISVQNVKIGGKNRNSLLTLLVIGPSSRSINHTTIWPGIRSHNSFETLWTHQGHLLNLNTATNCMENNQIMP